MSRSLKIGTMNHVQGWKGVYTYYESPGRVVIRSPGQRFWQDRVGRE